MSEVSNAVYALHRETVTFLCMDSNNAHLSKKMNVRI